MSGTAQIGVTGLAVMGRNLARNFARNGFTVAAHNRTTAKTDAVIQEFAPLLEEGDVIIDGGNAHFEDTRRREKELRERGIHFVGVGISGGEEGALNGPSIMPGGSSRSYESLRPPLEKIAAKAASQREIGRHRFGPYAASWLTRQRHYMPGSVRTVDQVLKSQVLPVLESRRINTFTSTVIDDFIMSMEERSVGLGAQQNAYDTLKNILLDAYLRGGIAEDPFIGVVSPEYIPRKISIPTLDEIRALKEEGSEQLRVVIDLMHGCGLRNGEAYAANLDRLVADDVYRITEQIDGRTRQPARLKHRKPGEFRESPLPATVRDSVLTYVENKGVDENG